MHKVMLRYIKITMTPLGKNGKFVQICKLPTLPTCLQDPRGLDLKPTLDNFSLCPNSRLLGTCDTGESLLIFAKEKLFDAIKDKKEKPGFLNQTMFMFCCTYSTVYEYVPYVCICCRKGIQHTPFITQNLVS